MARNRAPRRRTPLTPDRILDAAIELADRDGLAAVTMRGLGKHLGVEAMSLYKHVPDKEAVLVGIADRVAMEFALPAPDTDWRTALRASNLVAFEVLRRHAWAGPLLESTPEPGPARLAYLDAVIGVLRGAGFSLPDVAHAFGALDSHLYGFTMQVASWPFDAQDMPDVAAEMVAVMSADQYPNLVAMGSAFATSGQGVPIDFTFGLDLLLDGLERRLAEQTGTGKPARPAMGGAVDPGGAAPAS